MKKIILVISIILILITGLLLIAGCKEEILRITEKKATIDSLKLGNKIDGDKDIAIEDIEEDKTAVENEEELQYEQQENKEKEVEENEDTDNLLNPDSKDENNIEYYNDFSLLDIDKNEVSLSDYQGKIVVLNFWATWCPPCRDEIPDFIEVNNLYKDKNVQIIGVSIDTDIKILEDFVEEFEINYPTLIDGTIDNISPVWGIRAIPTTFILNENGEVLFENVGRMTKDQLIEILEEVLRLIR